MNNIYEPAALIADRIKDQFVGLPDGKAAAMVIAELIRALPNPPSEWPVFDANWIHAQSNRWVGNYTAQNLATAINARLAAFRPAPASKPDLERMKEAYEEASEKTPYRAPGGLVTAELVANLAAEGFRLGDANEYQSGYDDAWAKANKILKDAFDVNTDEVLNRLMKSRIDAAVLAEREACARWCEENGYPLAAAKLYKARTTNPEIAAPTKATASKEDVSLGDAPAAGESPAHELDHAQAPNGSPAGLTPLPGAGGDADRALLQNLKQRVAVLEYALIQVANQVRPLREWGGSVDSVMTAARENGWGGSGK